MCLSTLATPWQSCVCTVSSRLYCIRDRLACCIATGIDFTTLLERLALASGISSCMLRSLDIVHCCLICSRLCKDSKFNAAAYFAVHDRTIMLNCSRVGAYACHGGQAATACSDSGRSSGRCSGHRANSTVCLSTRKYLTAAQCCQWRGHTGHDIYQQDDQTWEQRHTAQPLQVCSPLPMITSTTCLRCCLLDTAALARPNNTV
jgi:hypothetical protein